MIGMDSLEFDPTDAGTQGDSDTVGSYLLSSDGTLLTHTTGPGSEEALDVNLVNASIGTDIDGVYNVSTNPTPDNVGLIGHTRAASITAVQQIERMSAGSPASDNIDPANVMALDVNSYLLGWDGSAWDRVKATGGSLSVVDSQDSALVSTQKDVTTTTGVILASEQAGRKKLWFQNLGTRAVYVGAAAVATTDGLRMRPGSILEASFGENISLHAVAAAGTQDTRILEAA